MYAFLNIFFFVFHTCIILFNIFGWIWKKTRLANLILLSLTAFSWFFLGIWYGYGYCPSTDWHWQVRMKLGIYDMQSSYLEFLFETFTGLDVSRALVDIFALIFLVVAFCASIVLNIRDWKKQRATKALVQRIV
ncbi:MAG: DUF2784 domain-containing protein [Candidatus Aminicenantes bacterium]|nr:DUF2784 domain-containing protein [Candidatus Aminicenantes bacterium]MDH5384269.1 DUF2784 domain-containing protein [Candidatus Aminicenantes bacterium]MDH5743675.1 DUF2784 domain-containing protein [Candidatus Aminicenantes bacterium]